MLVMRNPRQYGSHVPRMRAHVTRRRAECLVSGLFRNTQRDPQCLLNVNSRHRLDVSNAQIAVIGVFHDNVPSERFAVGETRKIAAILVADVVGYSRLAGADEDRTLARLRALRSDLIDPTIALHHGRTVKLTGDGALVEFRSVVDAVRCAVEIQRGMIARNSGMPPEQRIEFRIGIHLGDVVEEADGDLMGDAVNIAARLEAVAAPCAICLSRTPIVRSAAGSTWKSPISARPSSRTSKDRSGSIRCKWASRPKRNR